MKTSEKTFAERHPKLNLFLGVCILVAFICLFIFIILRIIEIVEYGISNLVNVASNLDAVVIVALITGAISLVSVIISSIIGKYIEYRSERRTYLAQKREDAYIRFFDMVYRIQGTANNNSYPQNEMIEDMKSFSKELSLWGSPKVVNKWIDFKTKSTDGQNAVEYMFILEAIMNEMRKDMGCKKVKKGNLLSFFINDVKAHM